MEVKLVDCLLRRKCELWMALIMICYFAGIKITLLEFYRKTTCGMKGDTIATREHWFGMQVSVYLSDGCPKL